MAAPGLAHPAMRYEPSRRLLRLARHWRPALMLLIVLTLDILFVMIDANHRGRTKRYFPGSFRDARR
jgi:hypothetical protein